MFLRKVRPSSRFSMVKVAYFAVGILCLFINALAKSLLPSNCAPYLLGPITGILLSSVSPTKKS